jgi:hypothetical protein
METRLTRASLTEARRSLLDRGLQLGFGRIEQVVLKNGEPLVDGRVRFVRTVKFGGEKELPAKPVHADFALTRPWLEFFEELDTLQDGTIDRIELRHGQPLFMEVDAREFALEKGEVRS